MRFFTDVAVSFLYQLQPEHSDSGDPERSELLLSRLVFRGGFFGFGFFFFLSSSSVTSSGN